MLSFIVINSLSVVFAYINIVWINMFIKLLTNNESLANPFWQEMSSIYEGSFPEKNMDYKWHGFFKQNWKLVDEIQGQGGKLKWRLW